MSVFEEIEKKWQKEWDDNKVYDINDDKSKKKFYCLEMFPYPSGYMHMGHVRNYSIGDAIARYKRLKGYNVFHSMGFDSFGLPAENAAIKHGIHPLAWTEKNISGIKSQLKDMGFGYDWNREVATHRPIYYKFNQKFFIEFYKKGLIEQKDGIINWCPKCETVLANEQVINGKCWRCNSDVIHKPLKQWYFKITKYADELLESLDSLDWPEEVKTMQRNWIGKSTGTLIDFKLKGSDITLKAFTTRIDTIFGVTYVAISPESPIINKIIEMSNKKDEIKSFIDKVSKEDVITRTSEGKDKNGVFTDLYLINPISGKEIPLWIADYVLVDYGTGVVMGVPAHDSRDFMFAKKYDLEITQVVLPEGKKESEIESDNLFTGYGNLINSGDYSGMKSLDAISKLQDYCEKKGIGKKQIMYKLRDWLISRQRYWGTPIPMIYCEKCGVVPEDEKNLPILLPDDAKFTGEGNPIETSKSFVETTCPICGGKARRETDTLDTFFDSSWYYLRYFSPDNDDDPFEKEATKYWMPVDKYIGGIEHAILHLMYARFFTKVLRDLGYVKFSEPFTSLLTQGMICMNGSKMSASLGNVVDPGEMIKKFGRDSARAFILFAASPEKQLDWSDKGIEGVYKFLRRYYSIGKNCRDIIKSKANNNANLDFSKHGLNIYDKVILSRIENLIKSIEKYYEKNGFNTAITKLMSFLTKFSSYAEKSDNAAILKYVTERFAIIISPITPHISEEVWHMMGNQTLVVNEVWPKVDETLINNKLEELYDSVMNTISDVNNIKNLTKIEKPRKITIFIADQWKFDIAAMAKEMFDSDKIMRPNELIKKVMTTNLKRYGKDATTLIAKYSKNPSKLPLHMSTSEQEYQAYSEFSETIRNLSGSGMIEICRESERSEPKAKAALPSKPSIMIE